MWVFVRLFHCLLIRVSLCFLGWLVGWLFGCMVYVCLCVFLDLRHIFALVHRAGSTSPSASTRPREFVLGGTLGRRLLILGLRFGALEVHFDVLLWPWGRTLDLFFGFSRKVSKKVQKRSETGS